MVEPLVIVIAACEIAVWVFLGAGLLARYLLRWRRLGAVLLVCTPLSDVVLLVATAVDLRSGGDVGFVHGLAAIYLGFSVAYGHSLLRWADRRFAHRFAGGPPPPKAPKDGAARVAYEWREWGRFVVAFGVTALVVLLLGLAVGQGEALWRQVSFLVRVGLIWLVVGPVYQSVKAARAGSR
ncbi:hypothetical protein GCM10022243_59320 [Saccharothrix violaceirubra]|uniref:Putative membrane protein n=1 Tax=Saccharothrix violaceirubra TaxID=413306 RepID=A0A7W7WV65_9PSEU|nr:hypothetical protein [Saccharothrix violaceirubra]MBB4964970.1 putative membrane protein [Saccharothrix violaceirubra]